MPSTFKPIGVVIGEYDVRYYQPTAAQTFGYGDWLIWNSAGTVSIAAASGVAVGNVDVVGRSLGSAADALAITDTKLRRVPVLVPRMNTEFVFPLIAAAATIAVATLALTDLDNTAKTDLDLVNTGSGWALAADTATNPKFRIMGLWGDDEVANAYGTSQYSYVRARPIAALMAFSGA